MNRDAFLLVLLWLSLTGITPAHAQATTPVTDVGGSLLQLFLGLVGVIALMIGSLWLLKKLTAQRGEAAGLMRVVAGTSVGTRERVVIVEIGSTWLVLGVAPGRVSALAEVPRQSITPPATGAPSAPASFPDWLRRFSQKK
jgi:flagellar protein FliO/FliZ